MFPPPSSRGQTTPFIYTPHRTSSKHVLICPNLSASTGRGSLFKVHSLFLHLINTVNMYFIWYGPHWPALYKQKISSFVKESHSFLGELLLKILIFSISLSEQHYSTFSFRDSCFLESRNSDSTRLQLHKNSLESPSSSENHNAVVPAHSGRAAGH